MADRLGILGGGQLGRMLAWAARPLGISVCVLEPDPDAPARAFADHIWAAYDDPDALNQLSECRWVTFEFENIPEAAAKRLAEDCVLHPAPAALRVSQDRWTEKNTFLELGIQTPKFLRIDTVDDARRAFEELGPLVFKTRRFGYDGKGQAVVRSADAVEVAYASLQGAPAIAEELVAFERELSIVVARGADGKMAFYPVVQNIHKSGILNTTIAPAPHLSTELEERARAAAQRLAEHLNYVGVLALELFDVAGELIANEFAPRVHNSGHWTIEGAVTSQFENHVRAVCGLPLGDASLRSPSIMTNLIGSVPDRAAVLSLNDVHLHDYEKEPRAGRKVGHVTALGKTLEDAQKVTEQLQALL